MSSKYSVLFKYEPSHDRADILPGKFPVLFWGSGGVGKDIKREHEYNEKGRTKVAYSILIDEGEHFRHRDPHSGSEWKDWGAQGAILLCRVEGAK